MSARLLSIAALSTCVLLVANNSTRRFSVVHDLSTLPNSQTKKLFRQLTPQGVAHLRSPLDALDDMEAREDARTTYAREAQELYAATDDRLVWSAWTEERIREAMNGDETLRVSLRKPIPAWILYETAVIQKDGEVYFLKDIYGNDAALDSALQLKGHHS
jgi:hypothetical protein